MIQFIYRLLCSAVFLYLASSTLYLLLLAVAGRWSTPIRFIPNQIKKRIVVLIPAYKEDNIIIETVKSAVRHNYPSLFFRIIVIGDSLKKDTVEKLHNLSVQVLEVQFDISTKARSLHAALQYLEHDHFEIAVILDADNLMGESCLEKINSEFQNGSKAIQCHRAAKNEDTSIALLGSVSEEININLFRKGPAALGLSAMPLGSGMAFDFTLLADIFKTDSILTNPAEDRDIEIELIKRRIRMEFLSDAYVYDEKASDTSVFQKQRIRWLEAQLNQIRSIFKAKVSPKTWNYYHVFLQSFFLPRLLYLVICFIIIVALIIQWMFNVLLIYPGEIYWITWLLTYFFVLFISIPARFYNVKTLRAIVYIPVLMISMLKVLFKLKKNRKEFLHTSKTYNAKSS